MTRDAERGKKEKENCESRREENIRKEKEIGS